MQTLDLKHFSSRLKDKLGDTATAVIHDYQILDDAVARVLCAFNREVDSNEARLAIAHSFNNQVSVIDNSFRLIPGCNKNRPIMAGFVRTNRMVRDYKDESGYKVMATNILMDTKDESLWQLSTSPAGDKYLTRKDSEDLSELLAMARVRDVSVTTLKELADVATLGEYVSFVDTASQEVRYGYSVKAGVDSTIILPRDSKELISIANVLIVEIANLNGSDQIEEVSNTDKELKDYYKELYSYAPDYYKQVEEIIKSRATA